MKLPSNQIHSSPPPTLGHLRSPDNALTDHGPAAQLTESRSPGLSVHAKPRVAQGRNWLPRCLDQPPSPSLDPPGLYSVRVLFRFGEPREGVAARLVVEAPVVLALKDGHGRGIHSKYLRVVQRQFLRRPNNSGIGGVETVTCSEGTYQSKLLRIVPCVRMYP
jgi:hypothetical protein